MRPTRLLDPADRQRIEAAVLVAERATAGELVVAVVRACDAYGGAGWRLGVLLALIAFTALATGHPATPVWALLAAQLGALVLGHLLARLEPIRRRLISERLAEARVAERARRAFAEYGLARTAGRTGVLVFVAVLERRVVVLADEGVNRVLDPDESWEQVVTPAVDGLRGGRAADGLVAAVARCGEILRRHLPAAPRDIDELPNALVLED